MEKLVKCINPIVRLEWSVTILHLTGNTHYWDRKATLFINCLFTDQCLWWCKNGLLGNQGVTHYFGMHVPGIYGTHWSVAQLNNVSWRFQEVCSDGKVTWFMGHYETWSPTQSAWFWKSILFCACQMWSPAIFFSMSWVIWWPYCVWSVTWGKTNCMHIRPSTESPHVADF